MSRWATAILTKPILYFCTRPTEAAPRRWDEFEGREEKPGEREEEKTEKR